MRKSINRISLLVMLLITFSILYGQKSQVRSNAQHYRVMFYNTENLYDPFNDSLVQDEEFLPDGIRHWTYAKFLYKLNNIAKVIIALGEWDPPVIIGLCEIENRFVSSKLVRDTPLRSLNYLAVHEESPDPRGVDVVLLYRANLATMLSHEKIKIVFPEDSSQHTRDILYVKLLLDHIDTLHVFVNHWPSKYGGLESSEHRREVVAKALRTKVDSLLNRQPSALIILMGDFNAGPEENCMVQFMKTTYLTNPVTDGGLGNLAIAIPKNEGTNKFQGEWSSIDQMIVSKAFLDEHSKIKLRDGKMHIFRPDFLLEKDEANMGFRPFRTFLGPAYHGGFSDHLPVFLDLEINIELESNK